MEFKTQFSFWQECENEVLCGLVKRLILQKTREKNRNYLKLILIFFKF